MSGRPGDLVLVGADGTRLTFATAPDLNDHRPVRGAMIDVEPARPVGTEALPDLIGWWRAAWFESSGTVHPLVASEVGESRACPGHGSGIRVAGAVDGVSMERIVCALPRVGFSIVTRAIGPLPAGATLGDEIDAGSARVAVDRSGKRLATGASTELLLLAERGVGIALSAQGLVVRREDRPDADELTRQTLYVRHALPTQRTAETLHVAAGDALEVLNHVPSATRTVRLQGHVREFDLVDAAGTVVAQGDLPPSGVRTIHIPPEFASAVLFRDDHGIPAAHVVPIGAVVDAPAIAHTIVRLRYTGADGAGIPAHVLFRGLAGTADPTPRISQRGYGAGRSVYLLDGSGEVALAPGQYRVTASHGVRYTLDVRDLTVAPGADLEVRGTLTEVVHTPDYIAGDFHLHAAPSPDSHVTLPERVAALSCEGIDFAVPTDHNHVTDYAPALAELGLQGALGTMPGVEVTTFAPSWGHFNAYPMVPCGSRSAQTVPFFETTPTEVFAHARERGARVIQVNHPRMLPSIGYFNFTHFDAADGHADSTFASDFNAVEAFNGWNIEHPELVRQVLHDLVGLVRRGMRPTATGNSDSHELLFEEAGYPRTYVHAPRDPMASRRERVIDGMLHGRTTVSSGPLVEADAGGEGPGAVIRPDARGHVALHIRVRAPAWVPVENVEVWLDDDVVQRFAVPVSAPSSDGLRFEQTVDVVVPHDAVLLVWVDATTPLPDVLPLPRATALGFTGLMYVDSDGDGRILLGPHRGRY